ncbi:Uncharacterised protein [Salmonella enterica subsp. enterica serovar Typhimurium str. DT104]|nr:Uncharacterised protein [Salmonella enterica subsp. enterica serovar Typhimurium str. DT104]
MKNRPGFVGFLLRRSIVRTGQLSVQQRALVHRAIRRRQRWRHMPPHAGNADIRAGDDGKDSVDAGTHGGIFIQRRVNRGAGAVGVRAGDADDTGAVSAGLRPHFGGGPCQRFAVDHHGRHDALQIITVLSGILFAPAIVTVAAGEHKRRFRDRVAADVLHRHLELHRLALFHFDRVDVAAVVPLRRIDRFNGDGRRHRVIAGQAAGVNRDVAVGKFTAVRQRDQFPGGGALVGGRPVVKIGRPALNAVNLAAAVGVIQRLKLVDARQAVRRAAARIRVAHRVAMGHARPGLIALVLGTQRVAHFTRQFGPLKGPVAHGNRVGHMAPHFGRWRIRAGGDGKLHAAGNRRAD